MGEASSGTASAFAPGLLARVTDRWPRSSFIARRAVQAVLLVLAVVVGNFILLSLAPGDPVEIMAPPGAPQEYREKIAAEYGLDRSAPEQLLHYVANLLQGDLGYSLRYRLDVWSLIQSRLGATLLLTGTGFLLSILVGVGLGVYVSRRQNSLADHVSAVVSLGGYSMPVFWLGQLALIVFAVNLAWFPVQGMRSLHGGEGGLSGFVDVVWHLTLPALVYSVYPATLLFRLTRARMVEALNMDFVTTARAKGISMRRIVYRHVLPNASVPIVQVIGYNFGFMLVGSVLVETVFGWPGMGALTSSAIIARDYPLLLGIFLVTTLLIVLGNLLADLATAAIDPRVAYHRRPAA